MKAGQSGAGPCSWQDYRGLPQTSSRHRWHTPAQDGAIRTRGEVMEAACRRCRRRRLRKLSIHDVAGAVVCYFDDHQEPCA